MMFCREKKAKEEKRKEEERKAAQDAIERAQAQGRFLTAVCGVGTECDKNGCLTTNSGYKCCII